MEKNLRVTGKASLKVKPDRTEIILTLTGTEEDYGKALALSAKKTEALRACFEKAGFDGKDLKTTDFSVNAKYENHTDGSGNYRRRFAGYEFRHVMKTAFAAGGENLGRALSAVSSCPAEPEFEIAYTVSDPEKAKNQLLKAAVENSFEKAMVLARAAGVGLGDIVSIDYSWENLPLEVRPMGRMLKANAPMAAMNLNIEPEDAEISDSVTVVWEIK